MLITCPACGTRYEVDAALIPPAGRTLRCSACRAEWTFRPAVEAAPGPVAAAERAESGGAAAPGATAAQAAAMAAPTRARVEAATPAVARTTAAAAAPSGGPAAATKPADRPEASMIRSLDDEDETRGRGGAFMAGFAVVALAALAAVVVYAEREAIAAAVPALAGTIESYAAFVDRLRAALADWVARLG